MILGTCSCIVTGCTLSLGRRFSHRTFWPEIKESKATVLQYVGETCRYLLAAPQPADPSEDHKHSIRMAFGNGLRPEIWTQFRERFNIPVIAEFYALTEGFSGSWNINTGPQGIGAIGRMGWIVSMLSGFRSKLIKHDYDSEEPLRDPQTGFCILAENGTPGELVWQLDPSLISFQFQGYYGNTEASAKKILRDAFKKGDAWFRTGDMQKRDDEGFTYFVDRIGDTYRWKSENVSTNEVAETLAGFPVGGVQEVNVYGIQLPNHDGRAGCAAIKLAPGVGGEDYMRELGEWAKQVMPRFKTPLFIRTMSEMEITGTNKHVKTSLRLQGVDPVKVGLAPQDDKSGLATDDAWVGNAREKMWWLGSNPAEAVGYIPFRKRDWDGIVGGKTRL